MSILPWILAAVAAGLALIYLMVRHPRIWLGSIILLLPWFLADTSEGLTASEVIMAIFIIGTITFWVAARLVSSKQLIQGWPDFFIIAFLVLSSTNIVVAMFNDVHPDEWLFEWLLFFILLMFFPLREIYGTSPRRLRELLALLAIATVMMAFYSAYEWISQSHGSLIYAYQLIAVRSRLFAPVFVLALCIIIPLIFVTTSPRAKLVLFIQMLISLGGLVQSLTRTLWAAFFVCLLITMFFLTFKQNLKLIATSVAIAAVTYLAAATFYPHITTLALKIVGNRLAKTSLTGGDFSFETRLNEFDVVWKDIKRYPLSGVGIRSEVVSWDPIVQFHWRKSFVHIGYVGLLYRMGLGLTLLMMAMLISFSLLSIRTLLIMRQKRHWHPLIRGTAIGLFTFQPALYSFIFVAGFFDQRYGNAMLAVSFAAISITHHFAANGTSNETEVVSPLPALPSQSA